VTGLEKLTQLK